MTRQPWTDAPWEMADDPAGTGGIVVLHNDRIVADMRWAGRRFTDDERRMDEANARLIAQAPSLFGELLDAAQAWHGMNDEGDCYLNTFRDCPDRHCTRYRAALQAAGGVI